MKSEPMHPFLDVMYTLFTIFPVEAYYLCWLIFFSIKFYIRNTKSSVIRAMAAKLSKPQKRIFRATFDTLVWP